MPVCTGVTGRFMVQSVFQADCFHHEGLEGTEGCSVYLYDFHGKNKRMTT